MLQEFAILVRAKMNMDQAQEALVDIFDKNTVLMLPFQEKSDWQVFQTLAWHHGSSMETCYVFPVFFYIWVYNHPVLLFYRHWVEFCPSVKLKNGHRKCQHSFHWHMGLEENGWTIPLTPKHFPACHFTLVVSLFLLDRFMMLSLEFHHSCRYDYVEVRDGDSINSRVIGRFCGNNRPAPVKSSGANLHVLFVSDGYKNFDGFFATFQEISGRSNNSNITFNKCPAVWFSYSQFNESIYVASYTVICGDMLSKQRGSL